MTSTTDVFATVASIVDYDLPDEVAVDSFDMLPAMLGTQNDDDAIRPHMLTQSFRGKFQLRQGNWKYLDHMGSSGNRYDRGNLQQYALPQTAPEATGQLFTLAIGPGETINLFFKESGKRIQMQGLVAEMIDKETGRTAPRNRKPVGIKTITAGSDRAASRSGDNPLASSD